MRNKFIDIRKANLSAMGRQYQYKTSVKKKIGFIGLSSLSFIIPDGSICLLLGSCVLSPLGFRNGLKSSISGLYDKICYKMHNISYKLKYGGMRL